MLYMYVIRYYLCNSTSTNTGPSWLRYKLFTHSTNDLKTIRLFIEQFSALFRFWTSEFRIMDLLNTSSMMSVKQCSTCQEETEYYWSSCQNDLCRHCKTAHVIDLDTKHHIVTTYRAKFNMYMHLPKQDVCLIHRRYICNKYRESELPKNESRYEPQRYPLLACFFPTKNNQQKQCSIKTFYQTKTQ